jgi:hypothetical protein
MPDAAPSRAADRNLLFGILALQMDFVTRDARMPKSRLRSAIGLEEKGGDMGNSSIF